MFTFQFVLFIFCIFFFFLPRNMFIKYRHVYPEAGEIELILVMKYVRCTFSDGGIKVTLQLQTRPLIFVDDENANKSLFTWRWGTPGR